MPATRQHNLPALRTSLIGREHDLAALRPLVAQSDGRMLTLTGAGGCGKTRLALQLADELRTSFEDGVWLVQLAALADPLLVPQVVAASLDLRESPGHPIADTLSQFLQDLALLLVLDNCEHLVDACAAFAEHLLAACPKLRILATSREALRIPGEVSWHVPSLQVPELRPLPPAETLGQFAAVRLFVERARAVRPGFTLTGENAAAVAQSCARLDGIPLAIELAAARIRVLTAEEILRRLQDCFDLLSDGSRTAPSRQQTLRATLDWSHDLLTDDEQALVRRLAVFAGGWSLEAAEAICTDGPVYQPAVLNLLTRLVDKSLVVVEERRGAARYRLLEPIRQYMQERLTQSGEGDELRRRHAAHYLTLAEQAEPQLRGPQQAAWLEWLERDRDNLRAVLGWSAGDGNADIGLRVGGALWQYYWLGGHLTELRSQLEILLATAGWPTRTPAGRKALYALGALAFRQGDYGMARRALEDYRSATRELGDLLGTARALRSLGRMSIDQGDYATARGLLDESLALAREAGDRLDIAWALNYLGLLAHFQGDNAAARALLAQSRPILWEMDDEWGRAVWWCYLGLAAFHEADYATARTGFVQSLESCQAHGYLWCVPYLLEGFAGLATVDGQPRRAAFLAGAAAATHELIGAPLPPVWREDLQRRLRPVRRMLSEATFAAVWNEGHGWTVEQAVAYALAPAEGEGAEPEPAMAGRRVHPLTARECQVAASLARGLTNRQIAEELVIAEATAERHVANILNKLGCHSRAQVAAWAVEHGLLRDSTR